MAVKIRCSECRKKISVDEAFSGSMCRCPYCKSIVMVPKIESPDQATARPRPASPGKGRVMRPRVPQTRSDATGGSGLENVVGSRPIIDITKTELRRTRRQGVTPIAMPGRPQIPADVAKAVADARNQAAQAAQEAKAAEEQANAEAQAREKAQAQAQAARAEAQRKAAEARARARQLEQAREQASAEARQTADAKARQAAQAEQRARAEADARRKAEETARKAAEEAEKRIRDIEQQAAKLVADAQQRARQQVEEATRTAGEKQRQLQAELEALKAASAGKSEADAEKAGQAAAEAHAQEAQQQMEAQAQAAADEAAKMIQQQLDKLRQTAQKAKQQAAEAQAAREAAEKQASQAREEAQRVAAQMGVSSEASAQAAREAMEAAKRAAREAEEATKAAANHAAKEQAARQQAQAGAKRAAQAEAAAREYEATAEPAPETAQGEETIPEAPVVDESKLTPEQLAAIPQADTVFFQGMVTLVFLVITIFMIVGLVYLGSQMMSHDDEDIAAGPIYDDEKQAVAAQPAEIKNPFQSHPDGPHVAGNVAIEPPVIYVVDAGKVMGEMLIFASEILTASARSLPADASAGLMIVREAGPETLGPQPASELADKIDQALDEPPFGATDLAPAVRQALQHKPKTVVLVLRDKDLDEQAADLAREVKDAGAHLVIIMTGYRYGAYREAIEAAAEGGATVRVFDVNKLQEFYESMDN